MGHVLNYSLLLIAGILVSQTFDLSAYHGMITVTTVTCLSYIMIQVGLEFEINKDKIREYGWDYIVAATAAAFPWIIATVYFHSIFDITWPETLIIARFAAPTSAGVLFTMLAAAGLASTWLFKKARILAIFDDLDTVMFMIPLQMLFIGFRPSLMIVGPVLIFLLIAAYLYLHRLRFPVNTFFLILYSVWITLLSSWVEHTFEVHLEVILPAFILGCLLYNPYKKGHGHYEEEAPKSYEGLKKMQLIISAELLSDYIVKSLFMFLVGCSLPKVALAGGEINGMLFHVIMLTILINLGKCFPSFCYRKEASLRERIALSVAMFPRGEVGAGVLFVAMTYGMTGEPITLGGVCLALNLVMTGLFIYIVKWLVGNEQSSSTS